MGLSPEVTVAVVGGTGDWGPDEEGYHDGPDEEEAKVTHAQLRTTT
jgi:hypothetical protein